MEKKAIGILGGMGPQASVYIYKLLIELSVRYFGAKNNDDFPEIVLHSIPVPDFISDEKNKAKALLMLKDRVAQLNKLNLACLSIACNTAHLLFDQLQLQSEVPFISMIEEVAKKVYSDKLKIVGLLGTPSTIRSQLYQKALSRYKIRVVTPDIAQHKILEGIIRHVIAGRIRNSDSQKLKETADILRTKGAQGIILGCTELPLVFPEKYSISVYNSVEILACALLRKYYVSTN